MIVPDSVKPLINSHLPIAVVTSTPETETGAMEFTSLMTQDLSRYDVIAFGMGISKNYTPTTEKFLQQLFTTAQILLVDADGLNLLAENNLLSLLSQRSGATILTPHDGEFKRLFPDLDLTSNRLQALQQASQRVNSIILLKGAKPMICDRGKHTWVIGKGTPALARGGSGDVLSGLITALVAQGNYQLYSVADMVALGAWLHQQGGILATQELTELGVDPVILTQYITKAIARVVPSK
jgi:NAD(P)H-hydrate epimerase